MTVKNGPWSVLASRSVYKNPWIEIVDNDVTHPDGSPGQYGVVKFANIAIGVLPLDRDGNTWLVGQHRFPHDRYSWELPEGGGPLAIEAVESARRELREETGLTARQWLPLCEMDISNSVTDERAVCFIATDLEQGQSSPEPSEALAIRRCAFSELLRDVLSDAITDSLTKLMVLTAYAKAREGRLPEDVQRLILSSDGI